MNFATMFNDCTSGNVNTNGFAVESSWLVSLLTHPVNRTVGSILRYRSSACDPTYNASSLGVTETSAGALKLFGPKLNSSVEPIINGSEIAVTNTVCLGEVEEDPVGLVLVVVVPVVVPVVVAVDPVVLVCAVVNAVFAVVCAAEAAACASAVAAERVAI